MTTPTTYDEFALRSALADLTDDQPPPPVGRLAAVRGRAVVRRRGQLACGVLTVVVMAGLAAGLTGLAGARPARPQASSVPSWALDWPDHRNGSVSQRILYGAVLAWLRKIHAITAAPSSIAARPFSDQVTSLPAGPVASEVMELAAQYRLRWYVGQTIAHGDEVAVMFEADGPDGPQLVVGYAAADRDLNLRMSLAAGVSPWTLHIVPAPDPRRQPLTIGENVTSFPGGGQGAVNWIVVLTAPQVRQVSWSVPTTSGVSRSAMAASRGLISADTGRPAGQVYLTGLRTPRGETALANVPVGIPGAAEVPRLAPPPPLVVPASFTQLGGIDAQGNDLPAYSNFPPTHLPYVVYGICYGPKPVNVVFAGHSLGAIACDRRTHELSVPAGIIKPGNQQLAPEFLTSDLTSYIVEFGTQR
jgi:hypothetical protein